MLSSSVNLHIDFPQVHFRGHCLLRCTVLRYKMLSPELTGDGWVLAATGLDTSFKVRHVDFQLVLLENRTVGTWTWGV